MPFAAECSSRLVPLALAVAALVTPVAAAEFAGLVDIGDGRKLYLECKGAGIADCGAHLGQGQWRRRLE